MLGLGLGVVVVVVSAGVVAAVGGMAYIMD